jgi:hypothetical protein
MRFQTKPSRIKPSLQMLLLTDEQIDRTIATRRRYLFVGLVLISLPFLMPQGWGTGFFSGFMILSLGIYCGRFQRWRVEPGIWMMAVLVTLILGTVCIYFEYLHFRRLFAPKQGPRPVTWDRVRLSVDGAIALVILAHVAKLAVSVAVKNWSYTRDGRVQSGPSDGPTSTGTERVPHRSSDRPWT